MEVFLYLELLYSLLMQFFFQFCIIHLHVKLLLNMFVFRRDKVMSELVIFLHQRTGLSMLPMQTGLPESCFIAEEAVDWCIQNIQEVKDVAGGITFMQVRDLVTKENTHNCFLSCVLSNITFQRQLFYAHEVQLQL